MSSGLPAQGEMRGVRLQEGEEKERERERERGPLISDSDSDPRPSAITACAPPLQSAFGNFVFLSEEKGGWEGGRTKD
jgi:hypothetical protein